MHPSAPCTTDTLHNQMLHAVYTFLHVQVFGFTLYLVSSLTYADNVDDVATGVGIVTTLLTAGESLGFYRLFYLSES